MPLEKLTELTDLEETLNHSKTRLRYVAKNLTSLANSFEKTGNREIAEKLNHEADLILETVLYLEKTYSECLQTQIKHKENTFKNLLIAVFES